ncbi:hypothetical protein B296_00051931 [Ensete ventricosum]|uniref:Uncharacterized protein n=1 Tax=Ensete ventricosum TaxID=4639 RepID=A0A426WW33_ENSVE|nr:hypothetical protein B296_00051931 [Ensete ventricosum]
MHLLRFPNSSIRAKHKQEGRLRAEASPATQQLARKGLLAPSEAAGAAPPAEAPPAGTMSAVGATADRQGQPQPAQGQRRWRHKRG